MMTVNLPDLRSTHLSGRLQAVLQAVCVALAVGLLIPFMASLPLRWGDLSTVVSADATTGPVSNPLLDAVYTSRLGEAEAEALASLGLSLGSYAVWLLTFEVALALGCVVVAVFIFWRRPEGWLTVWVALVLVILGTSSVSPEMSTLARVWPNWLLVFVAAGLLGMVSHVHFLLLAPDGRFVPRWTLRLAGGFAGGMLALAAHAVGWARAWGIYASLISFVLAVGVWLFLLGVGTLCQVYRYRFVSSPIQRQQTKWVVLGLTGITLGFVANSALFLAASQVSGMARVLINLARTPLVSVLLLALPICLAFSILRYRLWDIDLLIRRTLIYSLLTAALLGVYLGSVVVLQALVGTLTGERQSPLVTVFSTLAIAALFGPLRRRVQDFIDRRFYRQKYDAARTLAGFAAGARDETDLERLSAHLIDVVDETMQPVHLGLWLKAAPAARRLDEAQRPASTQHRP